MSEYLVQQLSAFLSDACALEQLSLDLLRGGLRHARDAKVAGIYRAHAEQTEEHLRLIRGLGFQPAPRRDVTDSVSVGALEINLSARTSQTSTQFAIGVYALENVEIAVYHLLVGLADDTEDARAAAVLRDILEQEEETAEMLASTLDRVLPAALAQGTPPPDRR